MTDFFLQLKMSAPLLIAIFIAVFIAISLIRLIFAILIHFALKRYQKLKKVTQFFKKEQKKIIKEEDELLKKLDNIPIAHSAARASKIGNASKAQNNEYELIASEEQEQENAALNEMQIVDIVKPVGFWTSLILGQKLTYLIQSAQIINKRGRQGFWVSMIEAQEQAAGREKGRMR